jgi:hypothetical protein
MVAAWLGLEVALVVFLRLGAPCRSRLARHQRLLDLLRGDEP